MAEEMIMMSDESSLDSEETRDLLTSFNFKRSRTGDPIFDKEYNIYKNNRIDLALETSRMISWRRRKEPEALERNLSYSLSFGEYYCGTGDDDEFLRTHDPNDDGMSDGEDEGEDEGSSCSSSADFEVDPNFEADPYSVVMREEERAAENAVHECGSTNVHILREDFKLPETHLLAMSETVLENILHFATERPGDAVRLETVCTKFHRLLNANSDDFWSRHPRMEEWTSTHDLDFERPRSSALHGDALRYIKLFQMGVYGSRIVGPYNTDEFYENYNREVSLSDIKFPDISGIIPGSAWSSFDFITSSHHRGSRNLIIDVLGEDDQDSAAVFRSISADILSRMHHLGEPIHFRLRGDTIAYFSELLQFHLVEQLERTLLLAMHSYRIEVQDSDVAVIFNLARRCPLGGYTTSTWLNYCPFSDIRDVSEGSLNSSDLMPSEAGVWRWPEDNCVGVLPAEISRRIVRRLAYIAGIPALTSGAFEAIEVELVHTWGTLLVQALELAIKQSNATTHLQKQDVLQYRGIRMRNAPFDMFYSSPPPLFSSSIISGLTNQRQPLFTIVPGQVMVAAFGRNLCRNVVLGDAWVSGSEHTPEEEEEIEWSYYFGRLSSSEFRDVGLASRGEQQHCHWEDNSCDSSFHFEDCSSAESEEIESDADDDTGEPMLYER